MLDFRRIRGSEYSAAANYQELIGILVCSEFPRDGHAVEGAGGDEGIDAYRGDSIDGTIHAYQAKYFLEPLRSSQHRQIRKSAASALAAHSLRSWTLCLPRNLTPRERRWFSQFQSELAPLHVSLWDKTHTARLLAKHRAIAEFYFEDPLGYLRPFAIGPRDTVYRRTKAIAVVPSQFREHAAPSLLRNRLLIVTGPPHTGKTLLALRLAIQMRETHTRSQIIYCQQGFGALVAKARLIDVHDCIFVIDDLYESDQFPPIRWSVLNDLARRNYVILTSRDTTLRASIEVSRLQEVDIARFIHRLGTTSYSHADYLEILDRHLIEGERRGLNHATALRGRPDLSEYVISALPFPHNIAFFIGTTLPDLPSIELDDLTVGLRRASRVETAIQPTLFTPQLTQKA